jgi:hypothetical protein
MLVASKKGNSPVSVDYQKGVIINFSETFFKYVKSKHDNILINENGFNIKCISYSEESDLYCSDFIQISGNTIIVNDTHINKKTKVKMPKFKSFDEYNKYLNKIILSIDNSITCLSFDFPYENHDTLVVFDDSTGFKYNPSIERKIEKLYINDNIINKLENIPNKKYKNDKVTILMVGRSNEEKNDETNIGFEKNEETGEMIFSVDDSFKNFKTIFDFKNNVNINGAIELEENFDYVLNCFRAFVKEHNIKASKDIKLDEEKWTKHI